MAHNEINSFIKQTADDYALSYEVVKDIYDNYRETMYEKLEELITERSKRNFE